MIIDIHESINFNDSSYPYNQFFADIAELNVSAVRIPLRQRQLVNANGSPNVQYEQKVFDFYKKLPPHIQLHGYIYGPTDELMEDFFLNNGKFKSKWSKFVSRIAKKFSDCFYSFEMWNEPNVSWSYLSRKQDSNARPWNAEEFVKEVLSPGLQCIREHAPNTKAIIGALADDGIVGHTDRPAPFSGQFSVKHPLYLKYKPQEEFKKFYVIPEFLKQLLPTLKNSRTLFDGIAIHPYPYFSKNSSEALVDVSIRKINSVQKALVDAEFGSLPIWITETGAREVNMFDQHLFSEKIQTEYINELTKYLDSNSQSLNIEKLFWYKYRDQPRDLLLEKPFGLVDAFSGVKESFFLIKANNDRYSKNLNLSRSLSRPETTSYFHNINRIKNFHGYCLPVNDGMVISPGRHLPQGYNILESDLTNYHYVSFEYICLDPNPFVRFEISAFHTNRTQSTVSIVQHTRNVSVKKENETLFETTTKFPLRIFLHIKRDVLVIGINKEIVKTDNNDIDGFSQITAFNEIGRSLILLKKLTAKAQNKLTND